MNENTALQLTKSSINLPATVQELNTFILIGKEKLNAHKAKIRAIEKSGMALIAKEAALIDAQDMADVLLDAEIKMGEILEAIPDKKASSGEGTRSLPTNVTKKQSHQGWDRSLDYRKLDAINELIVKESSLQRGAFGLWLAVFVLSVKELQSGQDAGAKAFIFDDSIGVNIVAEELGVTPGALRKWARESIDGAWRVERRKT